MVDDNTPMGLNWAKKPVVLTAVGEGGIILTAADGQIFTYGRSYYFAQVVMNSGLKVGDVVIAEEDTYVHP